MSKQSSQPYIPERFWIHFGQLSDSSVRVYLYLFRHGDGERSVSALAKAIRKSDRTIRRALQELRRMELLRAYSVVEDQRSLPMASLDRMPADVAKPKLDQAALAGGTHGTSNGEFQPKSGQMAKSAPSQPAPPPVPPPVSDFDKPVSLRGSEGESEGERNQPGDTKPVPYSPKDELDHLALEVARGLSEETKLPMYRFYVENYGKDLVYRVYSEVKAVPQSQIRKSRAALFTHLIRKYGEKQKENPSA